MVRKVVSLTTTAILVGVVLLAFAPSQAIAEQDRYGPAISMTVTGSPAPTTTPVFTATMYVVPEKTTMLEGETLDVTIAIEVSAGCRYAVYQLRLAQLGEDAPLFEHLSPLTDVVGPGISIPFTYTLQAKREGTIRFQGLAYGERYCGDYWYWEYVSGVSEPVTVKSVKRDKKARVYLSMIKKALMRRGLIFR